jgi:uncharacterized membrane protein
MPGPRRADRLEEIEIPAPTQRYATIVSDFSGYIRFIDCPQLVKLAKHHSVLVQVVRRVGHFVPKGVPLLLVSKSDRLTDQLRQEFLRAFDFGPTRTLEQDVEFGILQIVDIALKAISPAVNDPSTAITCVDQLSRILIRFAEREPVAARFYNPPGVLRVVVPWLEFERLVVAAFEQIRQYSKADVAVSLRILRALIDITTTTDVPEFRRALRERGESIVAGCSEKLEPSEMTELHLRLAALVNLGP